MQPKEKGKDALKMISKTFFMINRFVLFSKQKNKQTKTKPKNTHLRKHPTNQKQINKNKTGLEPNEGNNTSWICWN